MNSRDVALPRVNERITRVHPVVQDPDAVDVRGIFRLFWKNKQQIVIAAAVTGLVCYILVALIPSTYTATSKLLLNPRTLQVVASEQVLSKLDPTLEVVNGEISLLRSNILIEDVVRTIGFEGLAEIDPSLKKRSLPGRLIRWVEGWFSDDPDGSGGHVQSAEQKRMEGLIWAVGETLTVYNNQDSFVIVVRVDTVSPGLAQAITSTLVDRYIARQIDNRKDAVSGAVDWINDRLDILRSEVVAAELAVQTFKNDSLIREDYTLDVLNAQIADLNKQLIAVQSERLATEARLAQIEAVVAKDGIETASQGVTSLSIQALRDQIAELQQLDAVWARSFAEDHPRRTEIRREVEAVEASIVKEVEQLIDRRRSEAEISRLSERGMVDRISELQTKVMSITRGELSLRQLEREASSARATYESLLNRKTEARMQEQLQQPEVSVIDRAVYPTQPSAPRPKLIAVLGAAIGAALMAALIFFREMTATTFRTVREIETETGIPVLASMPLQPWRSSAEGLRALRDNPNSVYAERIRQLRASVLMRDRTMAPRSVLMMSSLSQEGSTMTTLALAEMTAIAGLDVIVVDCDLRHSTVQKNLECEMQADFADYIMGDCALADAIYVPEGCTFDLLGAKGNRSDAAERLSTTWIVPLIAELKQLYDVVLIDSPAIVAVADALILAQAVDTRLYLVEYDSTPRAVVTDGLARLAKMQLNVEGMILNKVDVTQPHDPNAGGDEY
jgi:polysaccharide biosynthesis transport protein